MNKQNRRDTLKEDVLRSLYNHNRDSGVTLDELCNLTGVSRDKVRKIIHELAVRDKIPISLKTEFPYGFYIKNEKLA